MKNKILIVGAGLGGLEGFSTSWYPFDQSLESRTQILQYCNQLMRNKPWHENLKKLVSDTQNEAILAPWRFRNLRSSS